LGGGTGGRGKRWKQRKKTITETAKTLLLGFGKGETCC